MNSSQIDRYNQDKQWWHEAVIYQIYPRSFADANGDGQGDLEGVAQRIPYLQSIGVDAVWFSPFFPSPQHDSGYDVADYFDIDPMYGTLAEFRQLLADLHAADLRVLIDLVPNHTSIEHKWFQAALEAAPNSPQRDRYIFRYSLDGPPNNWGSMFGGSAWDKVAELTGKEIDEGWWYLHLFDRTQPDLNWDNPDVHDLFVRYLRFWCELGVDGFRVDVAHGNVKAPGLPDDEIGFDRLGSEVDPIAIQSGPMFDQDGVHDIYRQWRAVLDEFGPDRMMVAEAWVSNPQRLARYVRRDEMSQSFNFEFLDANWNGKKLRNIIDATMSANIEVGAPTAWVISNHDVMRPVSRLALTDFYLQKRGIGPQHEVPDETLGLARARAIAMLSLGLPGGAYIYQGEELGLREVQEIAPERREDPTFMRTKGQVVGRDGCRVPLPWTEDADTHYGFGVSPDTWLPQPADWGRYAAALQDKQPNSTINYYRTLLRLRRELQLGANNLRWLSATELTEYAGEEAVEYAKLGDLLAFSTGNVQVWINLGSTSVRWIPALVQIPQQVLFSDSTTKMRSELAPNMACWLIGRDDTN